MAVNQEPDSELAAETKLDEIDGADMTCFMNVDIVCVYVFFPFIPDVKFVGRTSRGHTEFLIHPPSAVHACIFLARRIQPFLSFVDREVEFCVLTI